MKNLITVFSILTVLLLLRIDQQYHIPNQIVRSEPTELEKFLDHMANRESDNTPHVVNRFGMMGKYQFHPNTIKVLGFNVTRNQFLYNSPLLTQLNNLHILHKLHFL